MRSYFLIFLFLCAVSAISLRLYDERNDTNGTDSVTASDSGSRGRPDKGPLQTVRGRNDFPGAVESKASGQSPATRQPDLLASWSCQKTHWDESPKAVYIRGIAKNASSTKLSDVVAEGTFIHPDGNPLGTGEAMLKDAHLSPGQTSTFFVLLPAEGQKAKCSLAFRSRNGPLKALRASALEADAAYPFVGRWSTSNGTVAMDFFRDGTAFMVTDKGIVLGAGTYKVSDPTWVELSLSIPPEGVETAYLYWHDRWRALRGKTNWRYDPSRDTLSLLTLDEQISLTRHGAPGIDKSTVEVTEEIVLKAQKRLKQKGFDPGPLDGVLGPATRAALGAFQSSRKLKQTRELDEGTLWALGLAWEKRRPQEKRVGETP